MARLIRTNGTCPELHQGFPILLSNSMQILELPFLFLRYIANINGRSRSPETLRTYSEHLLDFFDMLENSDITWDKVTEYIISQYRNSLQDSLSPHTGRRYAHSTINDRIRTICRFYEWAHHQKLTAKLPFSTKRIRVSARRQPFLEHTEVNPHCVDANALTLREFETLPHALSTPETIRLLANLCPPYRLIAEWALITGLRRKEILALNYYQIPESFLLSESDSPYKPFWITNTKGGKPRDVQAPLRLLDRTHRYVTEDRENLINSCLKRDPTYKPPDSLFLNAFGHPVTLNRATRTIARAFRSAGLQGSLHSLRHTYAITVYNVLCRHAKTGGDINPLKVLQGRLGHQNISTTGMYLRSSHADDNQIPDEIAYLYGALIDALPEPPAAQP